MLAPRAVGPRTSSCPEVWRVPGQNRDRRLSWAGRALLTSVLGGLALGGGIWWLVALVLPADADQAGTVAVGEHAARTVVLAAFATVALNFSVPFL